MAVINNINSELDSINVGNSLTCSPKDCVKFAKNSDGNLKILHLNIRSINKNFEQLEVLLHSINVNFDIIVLTECWLSKAIHLPILQGFQSYRTHINSNQNDGIIIYVKQCLQVSVWEPTFMGGNCLVCQIDDKKIAIVAVYRSPSHSSRESFDMFLDSLNNIYTKLSPWQNIALIGDLNIDIRISSRNDRSLDYLILNSSHGLLPSHLLPTRLENCLDHVFIKSSLPTTTLVLESHITDHKPLVLVIANSCVNHKACTYYNSVNYEQIKLELESMNFAAIYQYDEPNSMMDTFISMLTSVIAKHTKCTKISSKKRIIKPWITTGLLKCIQNRDQMHIRSNSEPDNIILKKTYTRYRNFCNDLLRKLKIAYEKDELLKAKNNPKTLWNTIKAVTNTAKIKTRPVELLTICDSPKASINKVGNFFSNVGKNLADKILSQGQYPANRNTQFRNIGDEPPLSPANSLVLLDVDEYEVESLVSQLRNDCALGWDGISPIVLKMNRHVLIKPLTYIFNSCLRAGVFPEALKKAIVHPIHKGGSRSCVNNYRPISVLSALSKVLERILSNRLKNFLDRYKIIADNQYGFRSGISTEDAVLDLTQLVAGNLDRKTKCLGIFLDLSKAFDTVSVPILIAKLEQLGVRGIPLQIFKDYLTNRTQRTKIDNQLSDQETLSYGVPQGSILGPILFQIYINDLCRMSLPNSKIFVYADDTVVIVDGSTWDRVKNSAELALCEIIKWLNLNLLTLNRNKTSYIPFAIRQSTAPDHSFSIIGHTCSQLSSSCQCQKLTRTDHVKYLGVQIDAGLRWNKHIDALTTRTLRLIYIFKSLRVSANPDTLKMVFYALCQSVIGYCITVWGGAAKTYFLRVERAQRAILKVMLRKPYRSPTTQLYSDCKILTVRQLFVLRSVLRRHSSIPPSNPNKRTNIPPGTRHKTDFAKHQYFTLGTLIYKKIHKELNILDINKFQLKVKLMDWLLKQDYAQTESLLKCIA